MSDFLLLYLGASKLVKFKKHLVLAGFPNFPNFNRVFFSLFMSALGLRTGDTFVYMHCVFLNLYFE